MTCTRMCAMYRCFPHLILFQCLDEKAHCLSRVHILQPMPSLPFGPICDFPAVRLWLVTCAMGSL